MTDHLDRRTALMAATVGALALAGTNGAIAQDKADGGEQPSGKDSGFATILASVRCFLISVGWDGSNRRNGATISVAAPAGTFKTNGVYIQQNPGGGGWHEVARFKKISTSDRGITIEFSETGGQNYYIWLPVDHEVGNEHVDVTTSGPFLIGYRGFVDAPFPV
jgi:hypothetical protein